MSGASGYQERIKLSGGEAPIDRLMGPIRRFTEIETSGGILLIIATIIALIWANSPWSAGYFSFWNEPVTIGFGKAMLSKPLLIWVNDGLMALFFFVVGLEIKREIIVGELSTPRLAALPIAGAIGGVVLPALIYCAFNLGQDSIGGWGIPMATDIAFAIGVLSLLGKRVPIALKIFLTALAIVDDLAAVLVIAFFYTSHISFLNLGLGAIFLLLLILLNRLGVRKVFPYALIGIGGLWLAFLLSGVHPTIAGVLAAFCIPARTRITSASFIKHCRSTVEHFLGTDESAGKELLSSRRHKALSHQQILFDAASTPLERLESALHPWVVFFVMPVFALANAGVRFSGSVAEVISSPVGLGIMVGLVLGKQLGIFAGAWLAVKTGLASLPAGVSWGALYGVAWLGGIGFTMSIFIASLAFSSEQLLATAKISILAASLLAAIGGFVAVSVVGKTQDTD